MQTDGETDAHEEACLGAVRDYAKAPVTIFHFLRIKTEERFCYYDKKPFKIICTVRRGIRHAAELLELSRTDTWSPLGFDHDDNLASASSSVSSFVIH
jgi:hypothetical protein